MPLLLSPGCARKTYRVQVLVLPVCSFAALPIGLSLRLYVRTEEVMGHERLNLQTRALLLTTP